MKRYFEENGIKGQKCKIYDFNSAYYIGDYVNIMKQKANLVRKYSKYMKNNSKIVEKFNKSEKILKDSENVDKNDENAKNQEKNEKNHKDDEFNIKNIQNDSKDSIKGLIGHSILEKIKKNFIALDSQQRKLKEDLLYSTDIRMTKFTGYAFVVFNDQNDAIQFYHEWSLGAIRTIVFKFLSCFLKCCKMPYRTYKGRVLIVQWASAPTDVLWENLGYKASNKCLRKLITLVLTCIVMFGSFCLVTLLKYLQTKDFMKEYNQDRWFRNMVIGILISLAVGTINLILTEMIKFLTSYE